MVQVSLPKRIKRVGRRTLSRKLDYERVAAASLALAGTLAFLWVAVWKPIRSSSSSYDGSRRGFMSKLLRRKHPTLRLPVANAESYDAIAEDIIKFLDCGKLLAEDKVEDTTGGGGGGGDPFHEGGGPEGAEEEEALLREGEGPGGEEHLHGPRRRLSQQQQQQQRHRRLDGERPGEGGGAGRDQYEQEFGLDDVEGGMGGREHYYSQVTAAHLFCLAANADTDLGKTDAAAATAKDASAGGAAAAGEPIDWKSRCHCNPHAPARQNLLLDLWSSARTELTDDVLLRKTLQAVEQERQLVGHTVHLWAPTNDQGLEYMMSTLNNAKPVGEGGIHGLQQNLGPEKLFVDVGSCLGMTSMAVALLYPGTQIVSIEAASPNWLLQEMNWVCNDDVIGADNVAKVDPILGGVGPQPESGRGGGTKLSSGSQMAKFLWRPGATTSARAWTPGSERTADDFELTVKLRPWHELLAQAKIKSHSIDVLNVDCQGCEYNLIPALTESDFNSISTIMGKVHWGYIPEHKLPSSERGKKTHERLCQHESIAKQVKECCAFPDLQVRSSVPGEVLVRDDGKKFPPQAVTVKDVVPTELCDGFSEWAKKNHLYDVESDFGWFELTAVAD